MSPLTTQHLHEQRLDSALDELLANARLAAVAGHASEALAALGLLVNLVCAWLLKGGHGHHHGHDHGHHHGHGRHAHGGHAGDRHHGDHGDHSDLNLRSAYLHVLADAATSVMAIAALFGGMAWGLG